MLSIIFQTLAPIKFSLDLWHVWMDISYKSEHLTVKKPVMSNATSLDITKTMVLASRWHATTDVDLFMCVLLCLVVQMTDLQTGNLQMVAALPIGKYIVGDNACVCLEHLLTPFSENKKMMQ